MKYGLILALAAAIASLLTAAPPCRWTYLPINTKVDGHYASGLVFHFENPPEPEVDVEISVMRSAEFVVPRITVRRKLNIDAKGGALLGFYTGDLSALRVEYIAITMGSRTVVYGYPKEAAAYIF